MKRLVLLLLLIIITGCASYDYEYPQIKFRGDINQGLALEVLEKYEIPPYVHTIVFIDKPHLWYCGLYVFGGLIYINLDCSYEYGSILDHELRHAYWFNVLSLKEQSEYCSFHDYKKFELRACWEDFANNKEVMTFEKR